MSTEGGGDRRRAGLPKLWVTAKEERWESYVASKLIRIDTAQNIALYGRSLAVLLAAGCHPQNAAELDLQTGGSVATDVLGRSVWGASDLSVQCAADAIKHGPGLLLATTTTTTFSRAANFRIYATTALYGENNGVPLAFRRSFGEDDERADEAIAQLVNTTTKVATSGRCVAPLVSCELGFADYLIGRLAGDDYPFAAAIGPQWFHGDITHTLPRMLLGSSPYELFLAHDDRDCIHRRGPVRLIPMQYQERRAGLFYVLVPDALRPFFVVRPSTPKNAGIHQQMTAAADLAVRAATVQNVRPLDALHLEHFYASEKADTRWHRHMTILQAVLTFSLIDPFSDGPRAS